MKKQLCSLLLVGLVLCLLPSQSLAKTSSELVKAHERNTISLELEFSKKNPNALQRVMSFLNWGPNGYATGFVVGDHLVMTAYHVVSGGLQDRRHDGTEIALMPGNNYSHSHCPFKWPGSQRS